jgi:hypothetical protein
LLAVAADAALNDGQVDWFGGVADHELIGLVCAWDRVEAHAGARKLAAVAEVFRRNPEDGFEPGPGQMPQVVHEFTRGQLALALGESRGQAEALLTTAWHLAARSALAHAVSRSICVTRLSTDPVRRCLSRREKGSASASRATPAELSGPR